MPPKTVLTEEGLKKILREERENNKAEQENLARQFQSSVIAVRKEVKALADAAQPLGPPRSGATRIVGARAAVQAGKWSLGLDPITLANVKGLTSAWGHAAQCTQFLAGSRLNDLLEGAANADSNYNLLKGIVCFCCANELGTFPLGHPTPKPRRTRRPAAHIPLQPARGTRAPLHAPTSEPANACGSGPGRVRPPCRRRSCRAEAEHRDLPQRWRQEGGHEALYPGAQEGHRSHQLAPPRGDPQGILP